MSEVQLFNSKPFAVVIIITATRSVYCHVVWTLDKFHQPPAIAIKIFEKF